MAEGLREAGLPTPLFQSFSIDVDPSTIQTRLRYPCVVKPVDLSGSQGVIRADGAAGFAEVFSRVVAIVRACDRRPEPQPVIVEDFIPGREVAVEGLLRDGELEVLAIFDKPDPLDGPFFEETIYITPSRLDPGLQAHIVKSTASATRALGLREGPVHAELRINEVRHLRAGGGAALDRWPLLAHASLRRRGVVGRDHSPARRAAADAGSRS